MGECQHSRCPEENTGSTGPGGRHCCEFLTWALGGAFGWTGKALPALRHGAIHPSSPVCVVFKLAFLPFAYSHFTT